MKNTLQESSLSRILQHIESNRTFAVISAFRGYNPMNGWQLDYPELIDLEEDERDKIIKELDEDAHEELKIELRKIYNFGAIEQGSGYEKVDEKSFFIPNISYDRAFYFANKYKQQSILWKDNNFFGIIYTLNFIDSETGIEHKEHEKGIEFERQIKDGVITFNPEVLKYAYSQLFRGNTNQKKKFAFNIKENYCIFEKCIYDRWTTMAKAQIKDGLNKYKNIFTNEVIVDSKDDKENLKESNNNWRKQFK